MAALVAAALAALLLWSGASLAADPSALARVHVDAFGGTLVSAKAERADGQRVALDVRGGRLTPRTRLAPGERVRVDVVVRRPGADAWLLGRTRRIRLAVRTPVAEVASPYVTRAEGAPVRVRFTGAVATVRYQAGSAARRVSGTRSSVAIATEAAAGTLRVRAAARPWERLGPATTVRWFPRSSSPVALMSPAPGATLSPADPIRLTFSKPVAEVLGSQRPTLSPSAPGRWHTAGNSLVFTPTGYGVGFDTHVKVRLPKAVAVASESGRSLQTTREVDYTVPPGSTLRLHELLAEAGYLPLDFKPSGPPVARTRRAQVAAAVEPPAGDFSWRYAKTPRELRHLWNPKSASAITRGAVMMFQDRHGLDVDAIAGASVWHALIDDAIKNTARRKGYSYVYVHRDPPQLLTLWHNGHTVLTSPGNTGVPAAPTDLGTFPVFEHLPVTTMSGNNPDGSHYSDPGIKWVSYFNGGDALHAFNRASFGTPQSLGCVELPEASAARIYPYTPIGTLVTVEN